MDNQNISRKNTVFIFMLGYVLFFISLFIRDVGWDNINELSKVIRLASYTIIALNILVSNRVHIKGLIYTFLLVGATLVYGIKTRDLYWSILILIIFSSVNVNPKRIFKTSSRIVLIGMLIVVSLCLVGLLPDVINSEGGSTFVEVRHSLGFYHSNVLPLLLLYSELYYIVIYNEKVKNRRILIFAILSVIIYFICGSRNACILSVALSILILARKQFAKKKRILGFLSFTTRYIVPVLTVFSILMMFLVTKGGIWDIIDTAFSGRFRLALFKMGRVGLHLINPMANSEFFSDSITYVTGKVYETVVLDNGYLYIALRYGLIANVFYIVVAYLLSLKAEDNYCLLIVLLILFTANFVDNDLVDYSFLPFILASFSKISLIGKNYKKVFPSKSMRCNKWMTGNWLQL